MIESHVDIDGPEQPMPCFIVHPADGGPHPAVIFYMDAPGIREELHDMARRIAGDGFYVILPDLFYRFGTIRFPFRNERTKVVWRAIMDHLSNADVVEDTRSILAYLDTQEVVKKGPKGCIGHCMSGRFITAAAGSFPAEFGAAASLYGVGIVTGREDSSHRLVEHIKAEMYFGFAEVDETVPDYVVPTLQRELDTHGIDHVLEVIPGTAHGFCFPDRDVYNEKEAERVHAHFIDMCRRNL